MSTKSYNGSCHCKAVQYTAEIADDANIHPCTCSYCAVLQTCATMMNNKTFKLNSGEDKLSTYKFNKQVVSHHFCSVCGAKTHATAMDGAVVVVNTWTLIDFPRENYKSITLNN